MHTHSVYKVDEIVLAQTIALAKGRLVYMAPGVTMAVAEALNKAWTIVGINNVNIILDVDPEVFRLGYGEIEALTFLQDKSRQQRTLISNQPGIRIGLLIADEKVIIYTPLPKLIEANSTQTNHPNAIVLDSLPSNVAKDLGLGPLGVAEQNIGLDKAHSKDIENVQEELKANPPMKFNVAKTMTIFNSRFEFVELELKNCFISRKEVPLNSDLFGLAKGEKAYDNLRSSFKLISKDSQISEKKISEQKRAITEKYLIAIKKYGLIILRTKKEAFEKDFTKLQENITKFQAEIEAKLVDEINKNRKTLVAALLPAVQRKHPVRWDKFISATTKKEKDKEIAELLNSEIEKAFDEARKVVDKMEVSKIYKGITYELLHDEDFVTAVGKAVPSMKSFHSEFLGVAAEAID